MKKGNASSSKKPAKKVSPVQDKSSSGQAKKSSSRPTVKKQSDTTGGDKIIGKRQSEPSPHKKAPKQQQQEGAKHKTKEAQKQQPPAKKQKDLSKPQPINIVDKFKDAPQIWNEESTFQGVTARSAETEVCHFSFRIIKYPDEKRFMTKNKQFLTPKDREFMHLYRHVFCVDCCVPVYWMCLGESTPVQEVTIKKKQYLVFKCDCCITKSQGSKVSDIRCVECKNRGGYMKKLIGSDQFVHPVCALSFPNMYQLGSPVNMDFKTCNPSQKDSGEEMECNICQKSSVRMLKCKDHQDFGKQAHPFCIMNKNKELIYQVDCRQKYEFEDKFPNKWSFQLFFKDTYVSQTNAFDKLSGGYDSSASNVSYKKSLSNDANTQSSFIRVLCNEQRNQNTLCHCENSAADKDNVTQCSGCHTWYHQDCWGEHVDISEGGPSKEFKKQYLKENEDEGEEKETNEKEGSEAGEDEQEEDVYKSSIEKGEDFLLCEKCIEFNRLTKKALSDVILNKKCIEDYLPCFQDEWSPLKKLYGLGSCDFRTKATFELSIFEHVILYKFWYKLLEQALQRKLHVELYKDLLAKSQVHIFNNQALTNQIQKKLKDKQKIDDELQAQMYESFFFKEVFKLNSDNLVQENIIYNAKEKEKLKKFIKDRLKSHQIITDRSSYYYDMLLQSQNLEKIAEVYKKEHADSHVVKTLLLSLRSLPSFDHTQSLSFRQLDHSHELFLEWENKILMMLKESKCLYPEHKIQKEIDQLVPNEMTPKSIAQMNYEFMKSLFQNKISVALAEQTINSGKELFVRNQETLDMLQEKIDFAQQCQDIQNCSTYAKPVQALLDHIACVAQSCVKPPLINDILQKFKECQELRYTAESFITDKIEDNTLWLFEMFQKNLNPYEISQSFQGRKKKLRNKYPHYVFRQSQISELETKLKNCFLDSSIRKQALEKIEKIKKLKGTRFAAIKSEDATVDEVREYIKSIDNFENVDLDYERDLAQKKMSIMLIGQKFLDGANNLENQSQKAGNASTSKKVTIQSQESFMSQQSLQDIEHIKKILESSNDNISQRPIKQDEEEELYSIIDPESTLKILDENKSNLEIGSMEIDQNELMRAIKILENRQQDKINFPQEQRMMLNAKIQVQVDLQKEFQQIIDSNTESFNQQMVQDMKKCVMKAQKEHGIQMAREKNIIDNMKFSQDWFTQVYKLLKQVCSEGFINAEFDFKEFQEILGCVKNQDQLKRLLELSKHGNITPQGHSVQLGLTKQGSSKGGMLEGLRAPNQLVCAAKNLHMSLLRCKWMVNIQKLTQIGRFAGKNTTELFAQEVSSTEHSAQQNAKDIANVVKFSDQIDELGLREIVDNPQNQDEAYVPVLTLMKELSSFSKDYRRLFGKPNFENQQADPFEKISEIIQRCENLQKNTNDVEQLQKAVKALDIVLKDLTILDEKRKKLNVVNKAVLQSEKLEAIFEQAKTLVKFSREFNDLKLKNAPKCKLTIQQSQELLEKVQSSMSDDTHALNKLKKSIKKYEKFHRNYQDYIRFKQRLKEAENDEQGFARDQNELRFTYDFVQNLINDTEQIDIEILGEEAQFDIDGLRQDLKNYDEFKEVFMKLMNELEHEIFEKQTQQAILDIKERGLFQKFYKMRIDITKLPIFDKLTYKRIKAFVWIFNAYELLKTGKIDKDSPFHAQVESKTTPFMSIKQWNDFIKYHTKYLSIFPELKNHSIVLQLNWEVSKAEDLVEQIKDQKKLQQLMTNIWTDGPEFYKYGPNPYDDRPDRDPIVYGAMKYEPQAKPAFVNSVVSQKYKDENSGPKTSIGGQIGPNIQKDKMHTQFKRKMGYNDFLDKRRMAEQIKINLNEEVRNLNRWITEFEDLSKLKVAKSKEEVTFAYQPLFEANSYEKLKNIAKQVYVSPIYNWNLFSILKKRLETAFQIQQDVKFMIRDLEQEKLSISRVEPYLAQYKSNCRVIGLAEIDKMLETIEKSKKQMKELEEFVEQNKDTEEVQILIKIKEMYNEIEVDFEENEDDLNTQMWHIEARILQKQPNYKIDVDDFRGLDQDYTKFKIKSEWFEEFRKSINEVLKKLKKCQSAEDLNSIRLEIKESKECSQIDFQQMIEDKSAKFRQSAQNSRQVSARVSAHNSDSEESGSSSSGSGSGSESSGSAKGSDSSGLSVDSSSNESMVSSDESDDEEGGEDEQSSQMLKKRKKVPLDEKKIMTKEERLADEVAQMENMTDKQKKKLQKQMKKRELKKIQKKYLKAKELEKKKRMNKAFSSGDPEFKQLDMSKSTFDQANAFNDKEFTDIRNKFQLKVRGVTVKNILRFLEKHIVQIYKYDVPDQKQFYTKLTALVKTLEEQIFKVCIFKVEDPYKKKVQYVLENIKYLGNSEFREFCELMFVKQSLKHTGKLMQLQFQDWAKQVQGKLNARKKARQDAKDGKKTGFDYLDSLSKPDQEQLSEERKKEPEVKQYDTNVQNLVPTLIEKQPPPSTKSYIKDPLSEDDDEPYDDAVFSSEEEKDKKDLDDGQALLDSIMPPAAPKKQVVAPDVQAPIIKYNPLTAIQQNKSQSNMLYENEPMDSYNNTFAMQNVYMQEQQASAVSDPILYDPLSKRSMVVDQKERQKNGLRPAGREERKQSNLKPYGLAKEQQKLNNAKVGSTLRVWRGKLDLLAHMNRFNAVSNKKYSQTVAVDFYSSQDIKLFQSIPDWPICIMDKKSSSQGALLLKGKTEIQDVIKHFSQLERDKKKILKGWVTIASKQDQLNIDRVSKLFTDLKSEGKCSLFTLYETFKSGSGNTYSNKSQEIKEVHIQLMPITEKTSKFCAQMGVIPSVNHQQKYPQMFAFFINIKHLNYSQAEMLCISRSGQACLNPKVIEEPLPIKMEEYEDPFAEEQKIELLIKTLKTSNAGYEEIMYALKPYISKKNISKTSEERLMQFIQELIDQRNEQNKRQQMFQQQEHQLSMIKQEPYGMGDTPMDYAPQPLYQQPPPIMSQLTLAEIKQLVDLHSSGQQILTPQQEDYLKQQIQLIKQQQMSMYPPRGPPGRPYQ